MLLINAKELVAPALAGGEPAFGGRAERPQMQIADAVLVEAGGELALGEAGPARGGHGAHVDDEVDLCVLECAEQVARGGVLVSDREERFGGHLAVMASGARSAPWRQPARAPFPRG